MSVAVLGWSEAHPEEGRCREHLLAVAATTLPTCYDSVVVTPKEPVAVLSKRLPEEEACARQIRAAVPAVADVLAREFGVRKVVLFGPIARGTAGADSDIDLAVMGLPPEQTFRSMARAAEVAARNGRSRPAR